ncbi:MAG: hypothetical protein NWQ38_16550 [Cellulophaga sp.]|nr:hypothetical protein [Cellulophaga sp.]
MISQHLQQLGLGSSFNAIEAHSLADFSIGDYVKEYQLFYTGRHAIRHLIDALSNTKKIQTIWLPEYYCQHVTAWLRKVYENRISTYAINPFNPKADADIYSFASADDFVILNNFWGLYTYKIPQQKNRPIYIEDHSHGWLSKPCLQSTADYCFASLRKSLPIPLGGIIWSNSLKLPKPAANTDAQTEFMTAWDEITKAMALKTALLKGDNTIQKSDYLNIITKFEYFLHEQHSVVAVSKIHKEILVQFLSRDYGYYKKENLAFLKQYLLDTENFKVLYSKNDFTFGLPLVFKDRENLNKVKKELVENDIYPSELWPDNHCTTDLKYLLNIHVDFRYTLEDMNHIATTLNTYIKKHL